MWRLLAALTLATVAAPARARLPVELDGYRALKFGMTPEQVQKVIGTTRCSESTREEQVTSCHRDTGFTLAGLPSTYDLHFRQGKLFWIIVKLKLPESAAWPAYSAKYDELHKVLVTRYGQPDEEKGEVFIELTAPLRSAKWYGPGMATALWVSATCSTGPAVLNVAYADMVAMASLHAPLDAVE